MKTGEAVPVFGLQIWQAGLSSMFAIVICGTYIAGMGAGFDAATTVFESGAADLKCERAEVIGEACHKAADVARLVT